MQLLSELDQVCSKNRIRYVVGGIPARAVYEGKKRVFPCLDVYVEKKRFRKLHERLKGAAADRELELVSGGDGEALYYVDPSTTLIDSYDMRSRTRMGIHLRILPVEYAGADRRFLKKTKYYSWNGYEVRLPEDLKAWHDHLFMSGGKATYPGYPDARCIVSTTIGYERIASSLPEWDGICASMEEAKTVVDETTARIDDRSRVIGGVMDRTRDLLAEKEENRKG